MINLWLTVDVQYQQDCVQINWTNLQTFSYRGRASAEQLVIIGCCVVCDQHNCTHTQIIIAHKSVKTWKSSAWEKRGRRKQVLQFLVVLWYTEALKSVLTQCQAGGRDGPAIHLISTLLWLLIWDRQKQSQKLCLIYSQARPDFVIMFTWQSLKERWKHSAAREKTVARIPFVPGCLNINTNTNASIVFILPIPFASLSHFHLLCHTVPPPPSFPCIYITCDCPLMISWKLWAAASGGFREACVANPSQETESQWG